MDSYADVGEVVGLCDLNLSRLKNLCEDLELQVPLFTDLDEALAKTKPDCVLCATRDSAHHEVIVKALEAGCDAVTEKPMTIDDAKCRAILDAERRTGHKVVVTFNYRYGPAHTRIKKAILDGAVGTPYSVDFNWYLDCYHGADYFRRWHANMANSGGLLVHKATHHFDLVNWWIDDEPETVFAFATRNIFGPGKRTPHGQRCATCEHRCEFYWDMLAVPSDKRLYYDVEHDGDHYIRDGCVFRDDIDIYDTMSLTVRYQGGKQLTYSLHAGMAYEGYRLGINGSEGRLDFFNAEAGLPRAAHGGWEFQITPRFSRREGMTTVFVPPAEGGHGGGDPILLDHLYRGGGERDPYRRAAGSRDGAMSILIGVAANRSIAAGRPVHIDDLLEG